MHGGSAGSGAPHGNANALKTGLHTGRMKAMRRRIRAISGATRDLLSD
jgi:hypothetical protein